MKTILIVDDDPTFCAVLAESFTRRGFAAHYAHTVSHAVPMASRLKPQWVLADLKMPGPSGLELIPALLAIDPLVRIVVLTGYASIATAVEAIKLGAVHYLSKPVDIDAIIAAFHKEKGEPATSIDVNALTLGAAERDTILSAFERNRRNVSMTARELGMHRRTLQRKLDKMR